MSDRVGQQLGNYRLIRLIGRGSFAEVYLSEHLQLNTQAAIKVLHAHLTTEDSERLRTEARTMARLVHPHIVRVLDFDVENGVPFLIMEYAPNGTLHQRHPKGTRVPLDAVVSYVKQVVEALRDIHRQKLIHRNVKPENMLLDPQNEVLLTEFSSAIIAQSTRSQQTQGVVGSVTYMAPEQLMGKPRPASDQYSLALVVYEWLTGDPPFSGSEQQIANQHLSTSPPSLRARVPTIPPTVELVVLQALAKDPHQRFENVQAFALALERAFRAELPGRTLLTSASEHAVESGQTRSALRSLPTGTVTLLFTDIEGSTRLIQQLGERYAGILTECRELLRAAFQEWGGHEVDTQGDAFFVAFARATDAVLAAGDAQRALAAHPWPEGVAVRIRIGLHTGEPSLTPEGYVGLDVHRAARIMSAAHGGQVLLSQTTANLVEQELPDDVTLRDLGEHRLKDMGRPRRLYQLVISNLPTDFPPLKTLDTSPNNLPVQFTPFIGREQELTVVQQLLSREDVRLITLTGPGGTGKTRLGLQVAAELTDSFADGVFFVNLAPISDPALVIPTIAETLGIREGASQSLLERLREGLQQKQIMLLLDNFEQIVSAAESVVDLLVDCPLLKILVTSREVLHVRAEHEFAVAPLPLPDLERLPDLATLSHYAAVALFIQRTQAVKPDFQVTNANASAIVEICARLDGLPLAIELAAARIKILPPQALLRRLDKRLQLLTSGTQDAPPRQQTLRNTLAWSYNLLDAQEQQLFRCLAIFVGGCTLEAIESIYTTLDGNQDPGHILDAVSSLIDKSLLQQTGQEGQEPRFVMLETIREYGLERLTVNGQMEATRQAHASYYLAMAEEAEPEFSSPRQAMWLERLEREHENLRAVMQWSLEQAERDRGNTRNREMALRLGGALFRFWQMQGHGHEGQQFLERALVTREGVAPSVQAKALRATASLAFDRDQAELWARESLELYRQLGDIQGIAYTLSELADLAKTYAVGHSLLEEALALFREVGDKERIAWSLFNLGLNDLFRGDYARAYIQFEEGKALFKELGNKCGVAASLMQIGHLLLVSHSDLARARSLIEEALTLFKKLGDKYGMAIAFWLLARLAFHQGDATTARQQAEESVKLFKDLGMPQGMSFSHTALAHVVAAQGDHAVARALYEESLVTAREISITAKWETAIVLEGLAGMMAVQGERLWATLLWSAAEGLREAIGAPLPPVDRPAYESSVAAARAHLGERAFAAAWAEGRLMTPEQALAAREPVMMPTPIPTESSSTPLAKPGTTYPDGLTAREVEVLRLLAQGLTNEQVAGRLVISPRTVNTHLTSIYGKIQVTSRSAATRYAIEHHLVS